MNDINNTPTPALVPHEGWHVMHLYYQIDYAQWNLLDRDDKLAAKTHLTRLVQEICQEENTQLFSYVVATPKADLGFMMITPDLQKATCFEKRLTLSLGADVLQPVYSFLSHTERSEYTTSSEQYAKETLVAEKGMTVDSEEYNTALKEFEDRMAHYLQHRMYPVMPDWPVLCFYPMSKRRIGQDNWYSLEYDVRRELMKSHATTGRQYAGKILQLITGATGLDEHEWGVTLFAKDTFDIKAIVYEMRFDEVSARFAEFGDFYIGLRMPLVEIFERVCLD